MTDTFQTKVDFFIVRDKRLEIRSECDIQSQKCNISNLFTFDFHYQISDPLKKKIISQDVKNQIISVGLKL